MDEDFLVDLRTFGGTGDFITMIRTESPIGVVLKPGDKKRTRQYFELAEEVTIGKNIKKIKKPHHRKTKKTIFATKSAVQEICLLTKPEKYRVKTRNSVYLAHFTKRRN